LPADGAKPDVVPRKTLYVIEQEAELAVQLRLIWLLEAAVAPRPLGAVGAPQGVPGGMPYTMMVEPEGA